ncbi:MAG: HsdR family type I site-specific deoxyribonuclease [Thermoanaerobaculia bacterium]|nr:HsdR family type I site-specific deoxyribonuclease [Thermoanaerobaculia bacterium]
MKSFTEAVIEEAALSWLSELGYAVRFGPSIAPGETDAERTSHDQVLLPDRLRQSIRRLNKNLPSEALEDAFRKLSRPDGPNLLARNRLVHRLVVDGVTVEYRRKDGSIAGAQARVIDFADPENNDWLAVNQFTVTENKHKRRADLVLFLNGLPLAVFELKNAAAEQATIWTAYEQFKTYKAEIPGLFAFNEVLVISDGTTARIGTISAGKEWFKPWKTLAGEDLSAVPHLELQTLIKGVFEKQRFLDLIHHFIVFEDSDPAVIKKMAGYHQFHAVQVAVRETLRAAELRTGAGAAKVRVAVPDPRQRYVTQVPLVPLKAAAGAFGDPQNLPPDAEFEWASVRSRHRLRPGMFAARVTGRSMEPRIPDGSLCLFSAPVEGTRQGKTVLVELRDATDPETGERFTVKRYESEKSASGEDSWRHSRITLKPLNPDFPPIILPPGEGERLNVVAEFIEVLPESEREDSRAGDRRIGVVWHTQGSGKSLTMAFYAGRIIREPATENPTLVVLTDRNDLDDQLFGTFSRCTELLRQPPVQAESRAHLRELLSVAAGGVVFTTIHKFFPEEKGDRQKALSGRRNIVVIADEAHRSQYDFIDGFARHMRDALPNASFIGFTGTPIEVTDKNTRAVFGDYISVYDIQRAVEDGATVPIYYEGRLAKLRLDEREKPKIDTDFEDVTEGEEVERKEKLKSKWAQLEAIVGAERRIQLVADDLVAHWGRRFETMEGKAMIVTMSRRICVDLYRSLVALHPEWGHEDDERGILKVVMTGSASDPAGWQQHIRNKPRREVLARRFRDPKDPFQIVIVRDMWLTGFDAPSLHTMYVDKPMRGHGLMQAIARVNRVFRDKPGGLVVDYLGLADELKKALTTYTQSGGKGSTAINQEEAVALMLEKHEVCETLFHGFDWSKWISGTPADRLSLLPLAQEHILSLTDGKARLLRAVNELSLAFALAVPHPEALRIRDDVAFFQAIRAVLAKGAPGKLRTDIEIERAIRQIVSKAIASEEVVDIFAAAGLKKPDISILSDEFLAEVKHMPQRNVAVELLQKLLKGEIRERQRKNVVQARSFTELPSVPIWMRHEIPEN